MGFSIREYEAIAAGLRHVVIAMNPWADAAISVRLLRRVAPRNDGSGNENGPHKVTLLAFGSGARLSS